MGSEAHVFVLGGPPGLAEKARARVDELERRWSRFLPDSEITRLNACAGKGLSVSADTALLVARAVEAWRFSGGAFDPTLLGPLVRAGYDRSFEQVAGGSRASVPTAPAGSRAFVPTAPAGGPLGVGAADVVVDGTWEQLPAGVGFDPGGIGKGLAADLVVAELLAAGAEGACVNLGGDVRVAGTGPSSSDGSWTVSVDHPHRDEPLARLGLRDGAVATSTTLRRRWTVGAVERHHLIDPRSGRPAETDVELATVVAAEAWVAEALTKSVLLRRAEVAFDVVDGTAAEALAVDVTGQVRTTDGWSAFLGAGPVRPSRV
jgi:thiamine biosynthesis lipoprotein